MELVNDEEIKKEFSDNFSSYSIKEKRKSIAMCIMKTICGYYDSAILIQILISMKLLSKRKTALKRGKEFMFNYYYRYSRKTNRGNMNGENVLQSLYDSELNFKISCFWDNGFIWELGDRTNGFIDNGYAGNIKGTLEGLRDSVIKFYPNSEFSKTFKNSKTEPVGHVEERYIAGE